MRKCTVALTLATLAVAAANPALACGAAGGKAYRAAHSAPKTTVARKAEPASALATIEGLQRTTAAEDTTTTPWAEL